jgi:hypothetical protein
VFNEFVRAPLIDRHYEKRGLTALMDHAGKPLKWYKDSPRCLGAISIFLEADATIRNRRFPLSKQRQFLTVVPDGANWLILEQNR